MALWMRWLVSRIQVSMLPRSNARVQMPPSPTKEKQCSEVWISVGLTLDHQEHGKGDLCCVHARELGKDVLRINDKTSVLRDPSRQLNSTLWWTSKPQRRSASPCRPRCWRAPTR